MARLPWTKFTKPKRVAISDDDFEALQKTGKISLKLEDRDKLESILYRYMVNHQIFRGKLHSRKADSVRKRLEGHILGLINELEAAKADEVLPERDYVVEHIFWLMEGHGDRRARRDRFVDELRRFRSACEKIGRQLDINAALPNDPPDEGVGPPRKKPGTKRQIALDFFSGEVGNLYKSRGGRATATYRKNAYTEETTTGSPFARFANYLLTLCPKEYQPASETAMAHRIKDKKKSRPKA